MKAATIQSLMNVPVHLYGVEGYVIGHLTAANRTFVALAINSSSNSFAIFELMPDGSFDDIAILTYRSDAFELLFYRANRLLKK